MLALDGSIIWDGASKHKQGALCDVPRPLRESYQPLIGSPIRGRGGSPINLPLSTFHLPPPICPSPIPLQFSKCAERILPNKK